MLQFFNKIGFLFIIALTFVFSSCSYVLANPNAYSTTNVKLSFKVQGAIPKTQGLTGSKLLLPSAVALTVSFTPADVEAQTGSIVEGKNSEFTFTGVKNNVSYTILAEAKNASGKILFRQRVDNKTFTDEKNTLTMYLLPYSESGFDTLTSATKLENQTLEPGQAKSYEVSQNSVVQYLLSASASVLLYAQDSEGKPINASPLDRSVFYTSTASEKSYVTLYNAGTNAESYSLQFNQSNFSISYSLANASQALVFSTPLITTTINTELSISTSNATLLALSDWTWNVDGLSDGSQTTSAFRKTFTSAGIYTINCSVTSNGISYSGSMMVIVVNANAPLFKIVYSPDGCDTTDAPIDTSFYASGQNATILGKGSLKKTYKTTSLGFAGWNTQVDGKGLSYKAGEIISVTESLVLYAQWNLVVTIESQLITLSPVLVFSTTALATTTSIPVTIATDNTGLIGLSAWVWKVNGVLEPAQTSVYFTKTFTSPGVYTVNASVLYNGISYSGDFVVTVDDDTQSLLHIVYSTEGCDLDSPLASEDANEYTIGSSASILNPGTIKKTVNGNLVDFIAWNTKLDGSGTSYKAGTQVSINQDLLLYPQWAIVGKKGPAGGYIFYDKGSVSDGWRYLEAAPVDQGANIAWATSGKNVLTYHGFGPSNGNENTKNIILAVGNTGVYAAKLCSDYSVNGFSDWYLPTDTEANEMNTKLHYLNLGNFIEAQYYWTSFCNNSNINAWNFRFVKNAGGSNNSTQTQAAFAVRAVRAFKSIKPTYTITYDSNGGTGSVPIDVAGYEAGDTVTVKPNSGNIAKTGQYFAGWNTKADKSGTNYLSLNGSFTMPQADVTLYAQWGDLYVSGSKEASPGYWKNGTWQGLNADSNYQALTPSSIKFVDGKVYILTTVWNNVIERQSGAYWINGVFTLLQQANWHDIIRAFDVLGTNVYAVGNSFPSSGTTSYLARWINGTPSNLFTYADTSTAEIPYTTVKTADKLYFAGTRNSTPFVTWEGKSESVQMQGAGSAVYSLAVSGTNVYAVGTNSGTDAVLWTSSSGGETFSGGEILWSGASNCAATKVIVDGTNVYIVGTNGTQAMYKKNAENAVVLSGGVQASSIAVNNGNVYISGLDIPDFMPLVGTTWGTNARKAVLWINGSQVELATSASAMTQATDLVFVP